jgi:hypothetical protein
MSIRTKIANVLIGTGRSLGRSEGKSELAVVVSDHSITARMVDVDESKLAWDDDMYRYGNLYIEGYANPVKPTVKTHTELEEPDTASIEDSDASDQQHDADGTDDADSPHVSLISSPRYREYMRNDLISQLLNPRQQWRLIAYGIIALAIVMVINVVITLSAAGVF